MASPAASAWHRRRHVLSVPTQHLSIARDDRMSQRPPSAPGLPRSTSDPYSAAFHRPNRASSAALPTPSPATPIFNHRQTRPTSRLSPQPPPDATAATSAHQDPPRPSEHSSRVQHSQFLRQPRATALILATITAGAVLLATLLCLALAEASLSHLTSRLSLHAHQSPSDSTVAYRILAFLARSMSFALSILSLSVVLRVTEQTVTTSPRVHPTLIPRIYHLSQLFSSRIHVAHLCISVAACIVQSISTAACINGPASISRLYADVSSHASIAAFSYFIIAPTFVGAVFSLLCHTVGANVWHFPVFRTTTTMRFREQFPRILWLSVVPVVLVAPLAFIAHYCLWFSHSLWRGSLHVFLSSFITLLTWSVGVAVLDTIITGLAPWQGTGREALQRVIAYILSVPKTQSVHLASSLALKSLRDLAISSPTHRRIIFLEDASGKAWQTVFDSCLAPVERLTFSLDSQLRKKAGLNRSKADSGLHGLQLSGWHAPYGRAESSHLTDLPMFGEAMSIIWACETLSHLLVASRDEDVYGVAQRTLVHVIAALIRCKESVDFYLRLKGAALHDGQHWTVGHISPNYYASLAGHTSLLRRTILPTSDIDKAFAVSDTIALSMYRLVDVFRQHLHGYILGSETYWDQSLSPSLQKYLLFEQA